MLQGEPGGPLLISRDDQGRDLEDLAIAADGGPPRLGEVVTGGGGVTHSCRHGGALGTLGPGPRTLR